jgi:hypothetical protein
MLRDNLERVKGGYSRKSVANYLEVENKSLDWHIGRKQVVSDVTLMGLCRNMWKYHFNAKARDMYYEIYAEEIQGLFHILFKILKGIVKLVIKCYKLLYKSING